MSRRELGKGARPPVCVPPGYCIKTGYVARESCTYFHDDCSENGVTYQPDVYSLAGRLSESLNMPSILDLGCGTAAKLVGISSFGKTIGVDFGENLTMCRSKYPGLTWIECDLEQSVIGTAMWADLGPSMIICSDVIEHLLIPTALLQTVENGLVRGGVAIFSTPDRDLVRGPDDAGPPANPHHVREWAASEFADLLTSVGFHLVRYGHTRSNDREPPSFRTITAVVSGQELPVTLARTIVDATDCEFLKRAHLR